MIGLLQRVSQAQVDIKGESVARIDTGLLVLIGVERADTQVQAKRLLDRLLNYRVFKDDEGRMNRSVGDISGGLLLVPQFTLAADTRKGNRPGFSPAATPEQGLALFNFLTEQARSSHATVATGRFGADMQVSLINDGPVTFWLQAT